MLYMTSTFQGKQYTSIESSVDFNDLCVVPNTGLCMMAVEDQKMQTYYIPSLGKICSFFVAWHMPLPTYCNLPRPYYCWDH